MVGNQIAIHESEARNCPAPWVLLPGFDGTGLLFEPIKAAAPKGAVRTVLCYEGQTLQTYESLVQFVCAALPHDAPCVLIAESFSGPIAILTATVARLQPHALILCASFAACPLGPVRRFIAQWGSRLLFQLRPPEWLVRRYLLGEDAPKRLMENFYQALESVSVPVLQARLISLLRVNVLSQLAGLPIPVLYIHGSQDRLLGERSVGMIKQRCPNVHVATINAPHCILQREPARCIELIVDFLDKQ